MYTEAAMKKALGKKRWAWVQDYSFECGTIDILYKLPMTTVHGTTCYVCQPFDQDMTKAQVLEEIKYEMDTATFTWEACPYDHTGKQKETANA